MEIDTEEDLEKANNLVRNATIMDDSYFEGGDIL